MPTKQILTSTSRYRDQAHYHITHKRRQAFYALPQKHWQMLSAPPFNILDRLNRIDDAIEKNAVIADAFVSSGVAMYDLEPPSAGQHYTHVQGHPFSTRPGSEWQGPVNPIDQEKAHSTVKQLYRDWSAEGAAERRACFEPVVNALNDEYTNIPIAQRGNVKVLVPGAGLGRSVFEINRAGYTVEGNEISYHQIIASNYMLNFTTEAGQFELHPWIHGFSNHLSRDDQLQMVRIPDVHPQTALQSIASQTDVHPFERMSFSSADFCVAYKEEAEREAFNAVTTIFFIDTAPNVVNYVETVHNCLKKGGVWINLGPLKWHFENSTPSEKENERANERKKGSANERKKGSDNEGVGDPGSVELTEEEVMALVQASGFVIEKHETMHISTGYIGNAKSMWESVYHPSFWVARKQ